MKKFEVVAVFDFNDKKTVIINAMNESEAIYKWGVKNNFRYDYITEVTEIK